MTFQIHRIDARDVDDDVEESVSLEAMLSVEKKIVDLKRLLKSSKILNLDQSKAWRWGLPIDVLFRV